jgi:rhodanese-related sulfurtransferase
MADVPRDRRVIVYCALPGCTYSDDVAGKLLGLGYTDVVIFRGGWDAWTRERPATGPDGR